MTQLRRVPLDFDHPLGQVWSGFLNKHSLPCMACEGSTQILGAQALLEFCRRLILLGECSAGLPDNYRPVVVKALSDFEGRCSTIGTRWPFKNDPAEVIGALVGEELSEEHAWLVHRVGHKNHATHQYRQTFAHYVWEDGSRRVEMGSGSRAFNFPHPYILGDGIGFPTQTFHEIVRKLPGFKSGSFSGWEGDLWRAIAEQVGMPKDWHRCPRCSHGLKDADGDEVGEGIDPTAIEAYAAWESTPVPEGDAYQVWETVSEEAPISPPFATPEELARWLVVNGTRDGVTYPQWLAFITGPGWAPSGAFVNGKQMSGVAYVTSQT